MPYHALLEYIRTAKDIGTSDDEIATRLTKAGWYKIDVQDALELHRRLTSNTVLGAYSPQQEPPAPSLMERVAPLHYDKHVIILAIFAFVVGLIVFFALAQS